MRGRSEFGRRFIIADRRPVAKAYVHIQSIELGSVNPNLAIADASQS